MINYGDCSECGANKIHDSVSLCEVCEVAQRYETRLEQLQVMLDLAKTMRDAAAKEREEWEATAEKAPHEQADWRDTMHGLTLRAEKAERNLDQMRQCIEGFVEVVEAAEAYATRPQGGQQVPFHGDFASVPPSTRGQLRWWARRLKEASNEHSSESYRPS